jgi:hypothetical protein
VHHSTFEESMQAALQAQTHSGSRAQPGAGNPSGDHHVQLARVLAVGALLTAMSLASTAHAQDGAQPQQAGVSQSDPSPTPPPGDNPTPPPGDNPPVPRPITVKVSPQAGGPGTPVTISADVSGCTQPNSAKGTFGSAARPLTEQTVSGGQFTAHYRITNRDPVGVGRFRVVCDNANVGSTTFQVRSAPPVSVSVALSRRAGGPGTTVRITAEVRGGCDPADAFFQDRKGANRPATILRLTDRQLVATYTVSSNDAAGWGRFGVSCNMRTDRHRIGYATFQVRTQPPPPTSGPTPPSGGGDPNPPAGGGQVDYGNGGTIQLPDRIDTGQGGTADGTRHSGVDPLWLLPLAGLLLIAVALGLRLRQTSRRRP